MKKIIFSLLASSVLLMTSCSDNLLDIKFNIDMGKVQFTIPAQSTSGTFNLEPTVVELNLDSIAKANNVDINKFKSAKVKSASVIILSPSGGNFDAISMAELNAREKGSGLATGKRIASASNIPKGTTKLDLEVSGEDLLPIIKVPFEVAGSVTTTEPIGQATSLEATIVLEVVANPVK